MGVRGPIPVEFGVVFPARGVCCGEWSRCGISRLPRRGRFVQSADKATGLPLWQVEVIDPDPAARARTVRVKVAAHAQPVVPAGPSGSPFVPVEFTGLMVTPYVNQAGRLGYAFRASGVRAPGRAGGRGEGRDAA